MVLSKDRIKHVQNNFHLWHTHAQLEMLCGKIATAVKVYENVLAGSGGGPTRLVLWASYARIQWLNRSPESVVDIICRACGMVKKSNYSGLDVLRAKQYLDTIYESEDVADLSIFRALTRLRYLLELTTGNIESMFSIHESRTRMQQNFRNTTFNSEEIALCEAFMLLRSRISQPGESFPRSALRKRIADAISLFPNNTHLLGNFLELERGEGIWGRVRELIGEVRPIYSLKEQKYSSVMTGKALGRKIWEVWVVTQWHGTHNLGDEASRLRNLFSNWAEDCRYGVSTGLPFSMLIPNLVFVPALSSGDYGLS